MSPLVVLIFCCHLTYTARIPPQISVTEKKIDANVKLPEITLDVNTKNGKKSQQPEAPKERSTSEAPLKNHTQPEHKMAKSTEMESGALMRGVAVFVVLTVLVIVYMALRTYYGRRNKNPIMVNKYGVRTRRSDIEMTPLPLDEDEEDETLFEVHNTSR